MTETRKDENAELGAVSNVCNNCNYWHFFIGGNNQTKDEIHGTMRIYNEAGKFRNQRTFVPLHNWNDNWKEVAGKVYLMQKLYDCDTVVTVGAYSWGVGWGLTQLAKHLENHGIDVRSVVLSDPVRKIPFLPFASLVTRTVCLPSNVLDVRYFTQHNVLPKGHRIKINRRNTEEPYNTNNSVVNGYEIVDPEKIVTQSHVGHKHMDDLCDFKKACLEEIEKVRSES